MAIFPALGFLATASALDSVYRSLRDTGSSTTVSAPLYPFKQFGEMMGFTWVDEFDKKYDVLERK
jgi:hypothetical protein